MRLGCLCDRVELGRPYDKLKHCPACWAFWHNQRVNTARGGTGVVEIRRAPTVAQVYSACAYRGESTGRIEECKTCSGRIPVPLYVCDKLGGTCFTGPYTVKNSTSCNRCEHRCSSRGDDVPSGVVIGSYLWPSLTEMQIKLVMRTCGADTPILIFDDKSKDTDRRREVCQKYDVDFLTTEERIGHVGGDAAAFHYGLRWAKERGLRVLAKLSQRIFLTRPRWLQEGAKELLLSTLPIASRFASAHLPVVGEFPIRSEIALLDVPQWPESALAPKKYNKSNQIDVTGEHLLLSEIPGGIFHPWSEILEDRTDKRGHEINHWNSVRKDYEKLAKELGVTLDRDFHSNGWEKELARGEYLAG